MEPCKHEWEIKHSRIRGVYAVCVLCDIECDHEDNEEGICLDCGLSVSDDIDGDFAYQAWKERDL